MEMSLPMPIAQMSAIKSGNKPSSTKNGSDPVFGAILSSTLENKNIATPTEKTPTDTPNTANTPETLMSALLALFQPVATALQTTSSTAAATVNETAPLPVGNTGGVAGTASVASQLASRMAGITVPVMVNQQPQTSSVDGDLAANMQPLAPADSSKQLPPTLLSPQGSPENTGILNANLPPGTSKQELPGQSVAANATLTADIPVDNDVSSITTIPFEAIKAAEQPSGSIRQTPPSQSSAHTFRPEVLTNAAAMAATAANPEQNATNNPPVNDLNANKPEILIAPSTTKKTADEWSFKGSDQPADQQANGAIMTKQESTTVALPFQAFMESKSGVTHAEVSPTQQSTPAALPDQYDISAQIVEHAKLISRPQNTEMIIRLKPEHLGELTFKVAVEQGVMSATFHSNNPEVRGIIETSLPQLKQELNSQGIKLENVGVFAGMDQFLSGDQRGQQHYQQPEIPVSRKPDADFAEAANEIAKQTKSNNNDSGVDYRV